MVTNVYLVEQNAAFRRADDLRWAEQQRQVRRARARHRSDQHDHADDLAHASQLRRLLGWVWRVQASPPTS